MPEYFVAQITPSGHERDRPCTRIPVDDGTDALRTIEFLESRLPGVRYVVVATLTDDERSNWTHACRYCECRFDSSGVHVCETDRDAISRAYNDGYADALDDREEEES